MTLTTKPVVHLLGMGAMGTILAMDMMNYTNSKVIPLLRSEEKVSLFKSEYNNTIGVKKLYLNDAPLVTQQLCIVECPTTFSGNHIDNIIITTKTYQTKEALMPYLPFIDSKSNLILIQNGLGILEVLKEQIFTDKTDRPNIFQGVISHGAFMDQGFTFNHAGWAGMKIARLPWEDSEMIQNEKLKNKDSKTNELVMLLTEPELAKAFGIEHMTYQELLAGQLFKFLINCCINPVTATVDAVNGELVDGCKDLFVLIVQEALEILRLEYKTLFDYENEYNGKPNYPTLKISSVLNTDNMMETIVNIGTVVNAKNSSSMRQDTLYLRDTEIDYINGYIVSLARKLNLPKEAAKVNETVIAFVNLRTGINRRRDMVGDMRNI
ncbi:hypothetical protein TPHA_0G01030 [Tetrapisispora phaffii CBS 4417]|uniref:2-dehydropantoate 2-reductase n=1 Tax=Tetrapisispora phaffii (strain ATCC 24235 / CBS 4417 / NBRC 1672 / NRRL Y-8282 / UCD 70-5) TaxID=1071381 RepID=G8BVL1_TETPH|nr:hypothetical protein TPHA_0G01030 [Tetrapisispora phaffii CBS 4417]CCE63939.1 hypothetical protein TPHA_0G01030 [Tetrapisispora phaffii CBS 4417]